MGLFRSCAIVIKKRTLRVIAILIAHVIGVFGALSVILVVLGVLPGDFWLIYGYQCAILLMILMLSMSMSIRIAEKKNERNLAQERAIFAEKQAESDRQARTEQARFIAMLTHELKTPMSVIRVVLNSAGIENKSMQHAEHAIRYLAKS